MTISQQTETQNATATICDNMALYGAPTPPRGEADSRPMPSADDSDAHIIMMFEALSEMLADTQLVDDTTDMAWSLVNLFHMKLTRINRQIDDTQAPMRDLITAQDGSEVKANELEQLQVEADKLSQRADTWEEIRDIAAQVFAEQTGTSWRPRAGSHTSKSRKLTSAAIDARDYIRARENAKTQAHLPEGTLIAITGGTDIKTDDIDRVWGLLDKAHAKHSNMVLLHGGARGIEKLAADWADARKVHQVVYRPDWKRHGKSAPFKRNDALLELLPAGLIAFAGSGITSNLVQKARQLGIPVKQVD